MNSNDIRQRFFINHSPVRGDVVRLQHAYACIIAQKDYPKAIKCLLGEMLTAASLLIGTLKINGRLSLQLQSSDENTLLNWAMAECDHDGNIRGLADWKAQTQEQQDLWQQKNTADDAFAELGEKGKGVLFINIQPENGESYQGIVERVSDNLSECLTHYQRQSVQIPTIIKLACDGLQAGGILVQLLPMSREEEKQTIDDDLFPRLSMLTNTLKPEEMTELPADEILYRLYNEEDIVIPESTALQFGCTCSREKCESAILQLGEAQAEQVAQEHDGKIEMDCGFCGAVYAFNQDDIHQLFSNPEF